MPSASVVCTLREAWHEATMPRGTSELKLLLRGEFQCEEWGRWGWSTFQQQITLSTTFSVGANMHPRVTGSSSYWKGENGHLRSPLVRLVGERQEGTRRGIRHAAEPTKELMGNKLVQARRHTGNSPVSFTACETKRPAKKQSQCNHMPWATFTSRFSMTLSIFLPALSL